MTARHVTQAHDDTQVTRRLRLQPGTPDRAEVIRDRIAQTEGIQLQSLQNDGRLTIVYDASKLDIDDVLSLLTSAGGAVSQSILQRIRLGWYRYTDQNIHDNAEFEPHCCNKVPEGRRH